MFAIGSVDVGCIDERGQLVVLLSSVQAANGGRAEEEREREQKENRFRNSPTSCRRVRKNLIFFLTRQDLGKKIVPHRHFQPPVSSSEPGPNVLFIVFSSFQSWLDFSAFHKNMITHVGDLLWEIWKYNYSTYHLARTT